ncbi:MAG: LpxL/LpxP family Kdo(2)-lipid IV(A) lauroyl/palmitoleoyl acyltransferase [Thioalkalispiraceae bacterium]|jgi:lipid A biosynthesis lauroyl/palmitoleoyl acyltransferase
MAEQNSPLQARFLLNPIYWFTWLGIGLLYLSSLLPYSWMLHSGRTLGWLSYLLMPQRRRITRTNIRLVFPELDKKQVNRLVRECFYSASIAVFESAFAWWASDEKIKPLCHVEGLENLQAAEKMGKGILLLGGHYTTLEISGRLLAYYSDKVYPTYKPAHNKLFEAIMTQRRRRMNKGLVASRDMRSILKLLKQNQIIWYASDQDFGAERSVFAPFMGIQTATLDMSARLAKRSGAPVVPFYSERLPGSKGYLIRIAPMLENFPSGNEIEDATRVNAVIEQQVRRTPEQYVWAHRRFKTRPPGEAQVYKPKRDRFMRRYTYTHMLLAIPVLFYTLWIALKNRQLAYLFQRTGLTRPPRADLLVHGASIGEINAAAPLVQRILQQQPELKILLTCNTPSGYKTALKHFGNKINYFFMPLDWRWLMYRYLARINPRCILVMETELWPNFFEYCFYKGITTILVNGRLSEKSVNAPAYVRSWQSQSARSCIAILARSQQDANRFISLNVDPEKITVLGNIKYARPANEDVTPISLGRAYVLVASSRDEEEKQLVRTWLEIESPRPLLVIVPRHIQRRDTILSELSGLTKNIAVRSRQDTIDKSTEIYLADTFGELPGFIASAEFVIMGGSFEPYGGQNIIEVARAGKAVIFGPNMDNFRTEANEFLEAGAAIQVSHRKMLKDALTKLLSDQQHITSMGQKASQLVAKYDDILDRYMNEIHKHCKLIN